MHVSRKYFRRGADLDPTVVLLHRSSLKFLCSCDTFILHLTLSSRTSPSFFFYGRGKGRRDMLLFHLLILPSSFSDIRARSFYTFFSVSLPRRSMRRRQFLRFCASLCQLDVNYSKVSATISTALSPTSQKRRKRVPNWRSRVKRRKIRSRRRWNFRLTRTNSLSSLRIW